MRLRPTHPNHLWSWDFVSHATHDGRSVRLLNLIAASAGGEACDGAGHKQAAWLVLAG